MSGASVDQAVRLVRQAVLQDSKRNYSEAARCYRDAIVTFKELRQSRSSSHRLQSLLDTKLGQYEARLRILEEHLLSTSDLTKFFKELKPSSCRSSVSSESRILYKNPVLGQALDLLRRGRKEDERSNWSQALVFYESGLSKLLQILRSGHLTERQSESGRVKCLLYHERAEAIRAHLEGAPGELRRGSYREDSREELGEGSEEDCDSPVPPTETEKTLRMEEVVSCSSRLGSSQSLYTPEPREEQGLRSRSSSSSSVARESPLPLATKPSTHSLYPTCQIKRSPSVLSVRSDYTGPVPLARMDREMDLSNLSLHTKEVAHTEQIIVINDDCDESYELIRLNERKEEEDDGGSDSGYSGRSPDGTIRDSKSPSSDADRKSPFSDVSAEEEEEVAAKVPLVPDIIVVKEGQQGRVEEQEEVRQLRQEENRFQTPGKGILQRQYSVDGLAVVQEDGTDAVARPAVTHRRVAEEEVYGRAVVRGERVPVRAEARGEHGEMNMGCYYLMAALDFCWCL